MLGFPGDVEWWWSDRLIKYYMWAFLLFLANKNEQLAKKRNFL